MPVPPAAAAFLASLATYAASQGIHYAASEGIPRAIHYGRKKTYNSRSKTGRRAYKVLTGVQKAYHSRAGRFASGFAAHLAGDQLHGAKKSFTKRRKD